MGANMSSRDYVNLSLSVTAASISVYMLVRPLVDKNEDVPMQRTNSEKKLAQKERMRRVETLIMERGKHGTEDFRVHVLAKGGGETVAEVSLWHDISLVAENTDGVELFNFICEIPKCTRKKFEVATKEGATPIKQDSKKGLLREFKKGDIFFNYGCFPRTWENPRKIDQGTGYPGDNDPLDVCEIGLRQVKTGVIRPVKVLGILAMIDDDETDWKVVVIDAQDRWAPELNDIDDIERLLPGTLDLIREWFRTYKIPDGKPPNKFAFDEKFLPASFAHKIIHETHEEWKHLVGTQDEDQTKIGLHLPSKDKVNCSTVERDTKIIRNLSETNLSALA